MPNFGLRLLSGALACFISASAIGQGSLPTAAPRPPPPPTEFDARAASVLESSTSLTAAPIRSGGRVVGCAVNFEGVTRDHVNRRGGVVGVVGSVSLFAAPPNQIFLALKIVPSDLTLGSSGQIEWRPFTPPSGWVRTGPFMSSEHEQAGFECEGGGLCTSGLGGLAQLAEALPMSRLEIGIQRRSGGLDFSWSVDPSRLVASGENRTIFPDCMLELLNNLGLR